MGMSELRENSDFILPVMTRPQPEVLTKAGSDHRICLDGTHGTKSKLASSLNFVQMSKKQPCQVLRTKWFKGCLLLIK